MAIYFRKGIYQSIHPSTSIAVLFYLFHLSIHPNPKLYPLPPILKLQSKSMISMIQSYHNIMSFMSYYPILTPIPTLTYHNRFSLV
mmetsp:Transcript_4393/g.6427  ORF Transcript_4393/g.6427 Transcript_4393/m.6427 type:complete len:86 (+) Transcript_4393:290-547(+)